MRSKHAATLPMLQLSVLLALSSLALAKSCENVPLSFSTTVDLLASRNRVDVGSVTVTLENGDLSVTYTVKPSCKLADDIHVNLISTSSEMGISEIPRPGRFPCKKPASGSSESITCPISTFSIDDCCADELRLFLHGVVICDGKEDTAFGGSSLCSTRRWCNFEDVPVDISCDVCNECSTSDAACVPVMDGLQPTECSTRSCAGNKPTSQSCQNGQCVTATAAPCPLCTECDSGDCENLMDGSMPTGCDDEGCDNNSPFKESCMGGSCETVISTPCPVCNECSSGACMALADGTMPTGCDDEGCDNNSPFKESCMGGSCETVTSTPCPVCNECSSGACMALADGTMPTGCDDEGCDNNSPFKESCMGGSCETVTSTPCPVCNECSSGACMALADGTMPTGCDDEGCDNNSPFKESCMGGSCETVTSTPCPVCNECSSGACMALADGTMPTGCDDEGCDNNSPFKESCMGGSCETVTSTPCPVCNECSSGACMASADGSKPTGCDGVECFNAITPGEFECDGGACKLKELPPCDECNLCDTHTVECVFNTTSPMGEVCSTCGEICTPQDGGIGACEDRCNGQQCTLGDVDEEDVCGGGCQDDTDCAADEDCIEGVCVDSSICNASKRALCDTVFMDLSGTDSNSGKCCPATSACVKNVLNLDENSVCSTECGAQCDFLANAGSTNVREVYCVFGDETSTTLTAANLPKCADLAANIPNDCDNLNVCD
ncbi:Teneurin-1 [Gracilariopsis chorda]|uniref:Teneurin-1 n=1 Tax=Gracilariopsis chorda TaxID=448386 RepID=A0A2V3IDY9_9FLOR|nr:Teneurin-1 [Gracilariopsis chorda]|eukprot:PXF40284.1 Teneurin-1 [Gracilariopsis chorda]